MRYLVSAANFSSKGFILDDNNGEESKTAPDWSRNGFVVKFFDGAWRLIAPNGQAVDSSTGVLPHRYLTKEEAMQDAETLWNAGSCSTVNGLWVRWPERAARVEKLHGYADKFEKIAKSYRRLANACERSDATEALINLTEAAGRMTDLSLTQLATTLELLHDAGCRTEPTDDTPAHLKRPFQTF